jgi:hypothetical protein
VSEPIEFDDDRAADALEDRVIAIEQIIAARWPRSLLLRRRLAHEIRASVARYPYTPYDFRERRIQAVAERLHVEQLERDRRWEEHLRRRDAEGG